MIGKRKGVAALGMCKKNAGRRSARRSVVKMNRAASDFPMLGLCPPDSEATIETI